MLTIETAPAKPHKWSLKRWGGKKMRFQFDAWKKVSKLQSLSWVRPFGGAKEISAFYFLIDSKLIPPSESAQHRAKREGSKKFKSNKSSRSKLACACNNAVRVLVDIPCYWRAIAACLFLKFNPKRESWEMRPMGARAPAKIYDRRMKTLHSTCNSSLARALESQNV